jgi:hypothetical protein
MPPNQNSQNNDNEKPHRLDDIEQRLYSPNPNATPRRKQGLLHQVGHTVSDAWKAEYTEAVKEKVKVVSMNSSFFKKFFIASIIFFVVALGIGLFIFFSGSNNISADNVQINILGNAYTPGGEQLPLSVEIANSNAVQLELADLIVEYGRNKPDVSDPADITSNRISIGTIGAGKAVEQKVNLTLYGQEGMNKQVRFTLEYHVPGSNAIFQKEKIYSVTINTAPLTLSVDAETSTTSDQPYTLTVNVTPNTKQTIPNMMLKVDYPIGFQFQSAEPGPSYLTNVWSLGDVAPGTTKQIKILGVLSGQDGEERSFRVYTGSQDTNDKNAIGTTFTSVLHTVDIIRPFLQADLAINGSTDSEVVTQSRSTINATINWANNLPVKILNAQIIAKLNGALIDPLSVQPQNGFYNSVDNSIVWDQNSRPEFASINPGGNGSVGFTFKTKSLYQSGSVVSNPNVTVDVSISGKQPQAGTYSQTLNSIKHTVIKLTTDFSVSGQAFYSGEPFTNTGPMPPKVDGKTTYTIKWTLTSSANDVSNAIVHASLPSYVHFLNNINPTNSDLTIDPVSGDLIWNVGTVPKGSGLTGQSKVVYFQIELDPSISQLNTAPVLVNTLSAVGTDTYTNTPLTATWKEVTTLLSSDPAFVNGNEKVVQ